MLAKSALQKLYQKGSSSLKLIIRYACSPEKNKVLREWGIGEVAKMINKTPQTIRNYEDSNKIPKARTIKKNKQMVRTYNLKEINQIRETMSIKPSKPKNKKAFVLGVTNFKGGVGKSATSLLIAQSFALMGYKILLVDSDSQGTSTHIASGVIPDSEIDISKTLLNTLIGEKTDISDCIMKTHWDGLDIIPANLTLYNAELVLPTQIMQHRQKTGKTLEFYNRLNNSLEKVKDNYDLIILDTPPSLGFITLNVMYAVDSIIVPLIPSEVDFCSTVQFMGMAYEALSRLPDKYYNFIRILITRHKPGYKRIKDMEDVIRQVYGSDVLTSYMIETEAISKASENIQTILEATPKSNEKHTYSRALNHLEKVISELELLIKNAWDDDENHMSLIPDQGIEEALNV